MNSTEIDNTNTQPTSARHLVSPKEAAAYLGVTEKALERWRYSGGGPAFIKLSSRYVRYAQEDLAAHIVASRRRSTAQGA